MFLTTRQRNEAFQEISATGLDPASCELRDVAHGRQTNVLHDATQSEFNIWHGSKDRLDLYNAKLIIRGADREFKDSVAWPEIIFSIGRWAEEVKYELETPDLWAEVQQVPAVLVAAQTTEASNAPFTPDEQTEISARIDQVKDVARQGNPELTADQFRAIEQALDEVKEATTRVGRKDWILLANGALLGLIVNDLVPAHVVQTVFHVLITGIGHIFGIGGPPSIIST